jgi:hypothetical protein
VVPCQPGHTECHWQSALPFRNAIKPF